MPQTESENTVDGDNAGSDNENSEDDSEKVPEGDKAGSGDESSEYDSSAESSEGNDDTPCKVKGEGTLKKQGPASKPDPGRPTTGSRPKREVKSPERLSTGKKARIL